MVYEIWIGNSLTTNNYFLIVLGWYCMYSLITIIKDLLGVVTFYIYIWSFHCFTQNFYTKLNWFFFPDSKKMNYLLWKSFFFFFFLNGLKWPDTGPSFCSSQGTWISPMSPSFNWNWIHFYTEYLIHFWQPPIFSIYNRLPSLSFLSCSSCGKSI